MMVGFLIFSRKWNTEIRQTSFSDRINISEWSLLQNPFRESSNGEFKVLFRIITSKNIGCKPRVAHYSCTIIISHTHAHTHNQAQRVAQCYIIC